MKGLLFLIMVLPQLAPCMAGALDEERTWTGSNGRILRGSFHRLSPDGKQVEIVTPEGKLISIAMGNLIEADRAFVKNGGKPVDNAPAGQPAGDPKAFKECAFPDRALMGAEAVESYGESITTVMAERLWITMTWWDATGVIDIPFKGDPKFRKKWLCRKLAGLNPRSDYSLETELNRLYDGKAVFRSHTEQRELSAKRLSELASGPNVVSLYLHGSINEGPYYHGLLGSMTENGDFVLCLYGKRLVGKVRVAGPNDRGFLGRSLVFKVSNPDDLPKGMAGKEPELAVSLGSNDCVVTKPYVFAKEGVTSPPPPDPGFPVCVKPGTKTENVIE